MRLALILMIVAMPADAAPTYLECTFPNPETPKINITADEANSEVGIFVPKTGFSEKLSAEFTVNQIVFHNKMLSYVLDRTEGSLARTITLINSMDKGACEVVEPVKRKF
ncbi:MAG TPA: hypothetical protein VFH89_10510 [Sphingomicrobium sp.]|nr:hypothetical protein [Sphingomicrobium sp.]